MTPRRGLAGAAAALALAVLAVAAFAWLARRRAMTHPFFPTRTVETSTYRVSYPAHWEPVDPADPRTGEQELLLINHRALQGDFGPWDRGRVSVALRDEGSGFPDLNAFVAGLLENAEGPGPVTTWRLANGVEAKTWLERPAGVDIPSTMRWVALRGSNGRCYSAAYALPAQSLAASRYEHIVRTILGSMEFKAAEPRRTP